MLFPSLQAIGSNVTMCALQSGDLFPDCVSTMLNVAGTTAAFAVTGAYPVVPTQMQLTARAAFGVRYADTLCFELDSANGTVGAAAAYAASGSLWTLRCFGDQSHVQQYLPAAVATPYNRTYATRRFAAGPSRACAVDTVPTDKSVGTCWGSVPGAPLYAMAAAAFAGLDAFQAVVTIPGPDFDCAVNSTGGWQCGNATAANSTFVAAVATLQQSCSLAMPARVDAAELQAAADFACAVEPTTRGLWCFGAQGAAVALASAAANANVTIITNCTVDVPAATAFALGGQWQALTGGGISSSDAFMCVSRATRATLFRCAALFALLLRANSFPCIAVLWLQLWHP